jgi:carbon storage regulator
VLVLTRRLNQSIKIGDDIEIMIIEVRGDQVRLGVSAPRDISVHRKEVYLQIQNENKTAASGSATNEVVEAALSGLFGKPDEKDESSQTKTNSSSVNGTKIPVKTKLTISH